MIRFSDDFAVICRYLDQYSCINLPVRRDLGDSVSGDCLFCTVLQTLFHLTCENLLPISATEFVRFVFGISRGSLLV